MNRNNARHWIITQHDIDAFWLAQPEHVALKYWCYQIEEGEESKSWHAQIFMQFSQCVKGSVVQRMVGGNNPHIEVAHHPVEARNYCMKEDTRVTEPVEYGVFNVKYTQGYRTDLNIAKLAIREHGNYRKCLEDDSLDQITSRHPKWVQDQLTMVQRTIRDPPIVTVYYGPTMTGKTLRCHVNNPGIHEVRLDSGFINYSGQDLILFDEFDKEPWPFGLMLKLLDRYPFQVNIKNGYCWWEPSRIFMTSTEHPSEWYIGKKGVNPDHINQFIRRINILINTAEEVPDDGMQLDVSQ